MSRFKLNQAGIARMAIIFIVSVLVAVGLGGWWLWQRNAPQKIQEETTEETVTQAETPEESDEAPAQEAIAPSGVYSTNIPADWMKRDCSADNPHLLFIAPNEGLLGKCASEFFGLIAINRTEGDHREDESAFSGRSDINMVSYETVQIAGMEAVRAEYTQKEEPVVGPPVGTRFIEIVAYDGTYSFSFNYSQHPGWDDFRAQFDEIVSSFKLN